MKRPGIFFVFMLSASLFLMPHISFAQTVQDGSAIFDEEIAIIQSQQANNPGTATRLILSLQQVKSYFVSSYSNPSTPTNDQAVMYANAMADARNYIVTTEENSYCGDVASSSPSACTILQNLAMVLGKIANPSSVSGDLNTLKQNLYTAQLAVNPSNTISPGAENAIQQNTKPDPFGDRVASYCSDTNYFGIPKELFNCTSEIIGDIIKITFLNIAGFFLWLAGNILNYSLVTVLHFSQFVPEQDIYNIWQIFRQIISLCVVFAGLYMGFMYVINKQDEFIKRYLPWLVVFSIFVYFSYPLSRVAIDTTNVLALNVYSQIVGTDVLNQDFVSGFTSGDTNTAGGKILDRLGLQDLVFAANSNEQKDNTGEVPKIRGIGGAIMIVVFVLYTAYVLGFVALLMMVRNIILVLSIAASPLLFVDQVIPKIGEYASKFRTFFFSQLALAPVFMIMLYFSIQVMTAFNNAISASVSGELVQVFRTLMMFVILHFMLKITRSLSGSIGSSVESLYKDAALGVAMAPVGAAAFAGRATVGRLASRAAESGWMDNIQDNAAGRFLKRSATNISNSTFDARNNSALQKMAGMGGLKNLKGSDKTYNSNLKEKQKKFAETYNGIRNKEEKEKFAQSTLKWNTDGSRVAGETIYGDLKGEQREKIYNAQNFQTKERVISKDMEEAKKIDKEINDKKEKEENERKKSNSDLLKYSPQQDGRKRRILYEDTDSKTREKMLEQDMIDAEKERRERQAQPAANTEQSSTIYVPENVSSGPRKKDEDVSTYGAPEASIPKDKTTTDGSVSPKAGGDTAAEATEKTTGLISLDTNIGAALRARGSAKKT